MNKIKQLDKEMNKAEDALFEYTNWLKESGRITTEESEALEALITDAISKTAIWSKETLR